MHAWEGDPRQKPTPDYGSAGPDSDLQPDRSLDPHAASWRVLFAVVGGILLAVPFATGSARAAWSEIAQFLSLRGKPAPASSPLLSPHEIERLDHQNAQKQAELLLERAIQHSAGADDQIATRVQRWHGRLKLSSQLNALITTALNSDDLRVRAAGIEVDLAAMGVDKTPASVARLTQLAVSSPQSERIWSLWTLGLLGNRGVEPERVRQILVGQLQDSNPQVRHWAVEGLAYLGTDQTIAPLLQVFHDDPSLMVRERAACSLAQSGMLSQEQRRSVVPQLLNYADDTALDAQTHTWVYQALRDITGQSLPNDPARWRSWYSNSGGN
jgi:HEAT repeat protein